MGLPGLALAWGRWSEIGSAAKLSIGEYSLKRGFSSISPERGRQALDDLFQQRGTFAVVAADWGVVASQFPHGTPMVLSELVVPEAAPLTRFEERPSGVIAAEILACDAEDRKVQLVEDYLHECIRQILGLNRNPETEKPLTEMGLDSLVSTELRNRLQYELKVDLPLKTLLSGVSIAGLANAVLERLLLTSLLGGESARESVEEFLI
jgi:acyl carrier protein